MGQKRLSEELDTVIAEDGVHCYEPFKDGLKSVEAKYPRVAAAITRDAELRSRSETWVLETAKAYLDIKLSDLVPPAVVAHE